MAGNAQQVSAAAFCDRNFDSVRGLQVLLQSMCRVRLWLLVIAIWKRNSDHRSIPIRGIWDPGRLVEQLLELASRSLRQVMCCLAESVDTCIFEELDRGGGSQKR